MGIFRVSFRIVLIRRGKRHSFIELLRLGRKFMILYPLAFLEEKDGSNCRMGRISRPTGIFSGHGASLILT